MPNETIHEAQTDNDFRTDNGKIEYEEGFSLKQGKSRISVIIISALLEP
jgi:hypothetical protein